MKCKRLLIALISVVMSATCAFSSACSFFNVENEGGNSNITDNTDGDNTDGDNTDGDNTDGDGTGGDNTDGDGTGGDDTGDDDTGGDDTGDDDTGDDNTGDDNTGDDNTGDDNTGDDNTGDDNTGDDNTGDDNTGGDNTGDDNTGDDNTGDDNTGGTVANAVSYVYGGNECAVVEWDDYHASSAKVYYKLSSADDAAYTQIDSELIRQKSDTTARADIIGLAAGTYDIKIAGTATSYVKSLEVAAYDRSGYAHFNYSSGVGAYNDDGTLKAGAQVIYVTEATKNDVTATFGGSTYKGIVAILGALSKATTPVAVRVIGQIAAATWQKLEYNNGNAITQDDVVSKDGTKSLLDYTDYFSSKKITQETLIELGFNQLNTEEYTVLNGLTSYIKNDTTKAEFDSCWNNCAISGASNVTFEGVGEDAEIFQWGLTWSKSNSIEVRNLTFDDYTEDACSFEGSSGDLSKLENYSSSNFWFHHNTVNEGMNYWDVCNEQDKHEGDGGTDFKYVKNVTLSYNHYYKNHKTGLIGGSDSQMTASVTFHHNFYDQCVSRLPLGRQANMHMYNNYYYGSTGTNMSLRAGAYALIENCYFENANNPITTQSATISSTTYRGVAKVYGCVFEGKQPDTATYNVSIVTSRTEAVDNDNVYSKTFDTDSDIFYYDGTNERSDVENMLTAEEVKTQVPLLAGVMKSSNQIGDADLSGGGTDDTGDTGNTDDNTGDTGDTTETIVYKAGTTIDFTKFTAANLQGKVGEFDGIYVDATNGKFAYRDNNGNPDIQVNSGTVITFNVSANVTADDITLTTFGSDYTVTVENGVARIEMTGTVYLYSLNIQATFATKTLDFVSTAPASSVNLSAGYSFSYFLTLTTAGTSKLHASGYFTSKSGVLTLKVNADGATLKMVYSSVGSGRTFTIYDENHVAVYSNEQAYEWTDKTKEFTFDAGTYTIEFDSTEHKISYIYFTDVFAD